MRRHSGKHAGSGAVWLRKRRLHRGHQRQRRHIKNSYDKAGRKITSEDVDTGTTTTSYNAEGEIISVTDA
ncbi:MAG TPA: hypothetical protein ENK35_01575, partial [Candidatus Tenderia sp.]|nr:hypothetical protein [Candidatus Tenderia sp.]